MVDLDLFQRLDLKTCLCYFSLCICSEFIDTFKCVQPLTNHCPGNHPRLQEDWVQVFNVFKCACNGSEGKSACNGSEGKSACNGSEGKSACNGSEGKSACNGSEGKSVCNGSEGKSGCNGLKVRVPAMV